jgi:hypothetical protein
MSLTVIEGRWEEICAHASELQGRRVRLIILPEAEDNTPLPHASMLDFLGDYVGSVQGSDKPIAEQAESIIGEIFTEKARAEGLDV